MNISRVYGKSVSRDSQVQNRFSKFRSDCTTLRDEARQGRPSNLDQDSVKELFEWNPCKSTGQLTFNLNISQSKIISF